jgi:hypothetical protein
MNAVPIPNQRARWKPARCEEGELVEERRWRLCIMCISYKARPHWAAFIQGISCSSRLAAQLYLVTRRSFRERLLRLLIFAQTNATTDSTHVDTW